MGRRYERTMECEDCGKRVTRMWQAGQPRICLDCVAVRQRVFWTAAHEALEAHKRACRLELAIQRALEEAKRPASPVRPAGLFGSASDGGESTFAGDVGPD